VLVRGRSSRGQFKKWVSCTDANSVRPPLQPQPEPEHGHCGGTARHDTPATVDTETATIKQG
jgi:hypothetical protein